MLGGLEEMDCSRKGLGFKKGCILAKLPVTTYYLIRTEKGCFSYD
jgi:hypothetical protein